jgi:pimeloyl-ACP methyl ester carboxylesterase
VQVILEFGVQHPERVRALVPMCGSYGRPLDTFHDTDVASAMFPRMFEIIRRFPGRAQSLWSKLLPTELSYQIGVNFELNKRLVRRADFEPYLAHLASMDVQVFMRMLEQLNQHSVEDRLHLLRAPTLVIAGEKDTFTPAWLSQRMQQLIPNAELLMIPSGTHAAPIELPELVHLRLDRFLEQRVLGETAHDTAAAPRKAKATGRKSKAAPRKSKAAAPKDAGKAAGRKTASSKGKAAAPKKSTSRAARAGEATLDS